MTHADEFDVLFEGVGLGRNLLVEPVPGEPHRVGYQAMNRVDGTPAEFRRPYCRSFVIAVNSERRERLLPPNTEVAVARGARLVSNRDPLGAGPPGPGPRDAIERPLVRFSKILADGNRRLAVGEGFHGTRLSQPGREPLAGVMNRCARKAMLLMRFDEDFPKA